MCPCPHRRPVSSRPAVWTWADGLSSEPRGLLTLRTSDSVAGCPASSHQWDGTRLSLRSQGSVSAWGVLPPVGFWGGVLTEPLCSQPQARTHGRHFWGPSIIKTSQRQVCGRPPRRVGRQTRNQLDLNRGRCRQGPDGGTLSQGRVEEPHLVPR